MRADRPLPARRPDAGGAPPPRLPAVRTPDPGPHRVRRPRPHPAPVRSVAAHAVPAGPPERFTGRGAVALLPLPPAGGVPGERLPARGARREPGRQPRRSTGGGGPRRDPRARALRLAAVRLGRVRARRTALPRGGAVPPSPEPCARGLAGGGRAQRRRRDAVRADDLRSERPAHLPPQPYVAGSHRALRPHYPG